MTHKNVAQPKEKMSLSCTLTVHLWIMRVDIWFPVHFITKNTGSKGPLMNCMCDLMQFVISNITFETTPTNLAHLFMSKVVLSFGMCSSVVI